MLRAFLEFCLRERLIIVLVTAVAAGVGFYVVRTIPIDAIPNVGENQVIVITDWPGRSPKDIEDQITYPLSVALLSVPGADSVRGRSMFGSSFVQVTFKDRVDFYWARSRVSEQLAAAASLLPAGVRPLLGPDATALGQILYYTLEPPAGMNLSALRSLQDYVVKYELQSVDGVSQVASIGGYVRQYQVEVDPDKLRFHSVPLDEIIAAVRQSNIDVGAMTVESTGMEFIIRGKGFIGRSGDMWQDVADIEHTVVRTREGIPVRIRDLGHVQVGPDFRRGALDLNGSEAVGGIVTMRFGENPRAVIRRVREKMAALEPSLPGVTFHVVYDRTELINETVATLTDALKEEVLITVAVIVLFLLHVRASIVVAVTLPLAVLLAFIAMRVFGIDANIMSLAGIAIAIGEVCDLGIILTENVYRHLADWETAGRPGGKEQRLRVILAGANEVASPVVTAVSSTIVSFIPVFALTGRDYKLFAPLAWTKTFTMVSALIVALSLTPLLCRLLLHSGRASRWRAIVAGLGAGALLAGLAFLYGEQLLPRLGPQSSALGREVATVVAFAVGFAVGYAISRERLRPIDENPTSRLITAVYAPLLSLLLRHKLAFLMVPVLVVVCGAGAWFGLPNVLRPFERAAGLVAADLNRFPGYAEVKHALPGLETADWIQLDEGTWFYMPTLYPAASLSQAMQVLQTQDALIRQVPEVDNVLGKIGRAESALDPAPIAMIETYVTLKPKSEWREGMTERGIWDEISAAARLPGVTPASPLQPIEGRVVMLQSGIRAAMAIRIYGDDLGELSRASLAVARRLRELPHVDGKTVNPDIVLGKPYVEFEVDRRTAARFGMTTAMVNEIIEAALGGMNVTTTVEGRERYPIRVRYQRDLREEIEELERLPVVTPGGEVVPLEMLAKMEMAWGPEMVASEDARLVAHVMFSPSGAFGDLETARAVEASLRNAAALPAGDPLRLDLPTGYFVQAVGSFENQIETNRRLMWVVPLVVLTSLFVVYLEFRDPVMTLIVMAPVPVTFSGGMLALALFGVEMNTAIWIGFISLLGIAEDDGVVILTYLRQVFAERHPRTIAEIRAATLEAGLKRIRPALMTTVTTFVGLIPVLTATGRGGDLARAMALPVVGGMVFDLIGLFIVPVLFCGYMEMRSRVGYAGPAE
jgi:Cu(I)/Ag(I) efflux system membrane protein CusA/SilA